MTDSDSFHDARTDSRTLDPDATVRSNYVFQRHDESFDRTISFRPASIDRDLGRVHTWLNYEHVVAFWDLDRSLPAVYDHLADKLSAAHLTPYIGYIDHVPMSYWEVYWPSEFELSAYYDARPTDRAAHLLVGPPEYVHKGYSRALLRAMGRMIFSNPDTKRAVVEPDVENDVVIHVLEQCGFEARTEFYFEEADKDALLMVCDQESFESALRSGSTATGTNGSTNV
ncbi:GNAT family N-acetyltransferase [Halocatena halophila]|uniref:GNAT family N-acetyltransferase n=1 Tax=Halocatena halophila TaxID=2814576 RepID=UPI002ED3DE65